MEYVELNMVRCGVVAHSGEWAWSGYSELMGSRLWDGQRLLWLLRCSGVDDFRPHFKAASNQALIHGELERRAKWTEAVVGGRAFVEAIEEQIRWRASKWGSN